MKTWIATVVLLAAAPATAGPRGFWCLEIGDSASVCTRRKDHCDLTARAARQNGVQTSECSSYDRAWLTRYRMGGERVEALLITKAHCESHRALMGGSPCKEQR